MAAQWYCKISGKAIGPLSSRQLKMLADDGRLQPDNPVRQGNQGKWVPAQRVKGLFPPADSSRAESDAKIPPQNAARVPPSPRAASRGTGFGIGSK